MSTHVRMSIVSFLLGGLLCGWLAFEITACTPAQREIAAVVVPAVQRGACVILRALAPDGVTDTICATADELAPFVRTLLEERTEEAPKLSSGAGPAEVAPARLALAVKLEPVAELPAPPRRVAKRRCAHWVPVLSSSSADAASSDASAEAGDR
jgi:hypothetical protein